MRNARARAWDARFLGAHPQDLPSFPALSFGQNSTLLGMPLSGALTNPRTKADLSIGIAPLGRTQNREREPVCPAAWRPPPGPSPRPGFTQQM